MKTILFFDSTEEGREIAGWIAKEKKIKVEAPSSYEDYLRKLNYSKYDLVITELEFDNIKPFEVIKKTQEKAGSIFHIVITSSKDIYKITSAEVYGVREVLFKPVDYNLLSKYIDRYLCGKKIFLIAASRERNDYISAAINHTGHIAKCICREFEFVRASHELRFDYLIYDESFNAVPAEVFFEKMNMIKTNKKLIAIVKNKSNYELLGILKKYKVDAVWGYDLIGEEISEAIMDFAEKNFVIELKEEKENQINLEAGQKEEKIQKIEKEIPEKKEKKVFLISPIKFARDLEDKYYDKNFVKPLTDYLRKRDSSLLDNALAILNVSKGEPLQLLLAEVYRKADYNLKESIIELFAKIKSKVALNTLLIALKDPDSEIRFLALSGLENKKNERVKKFVSFRLTDESSRVRKMAAVLLEGYNDVEVATRYVEAIEKNNDGNIVASLKKVIEKGIDVKKNLKFLASIYNRVPRDVKETILEKMISTKNKDALPFILRQVGSEDDIISRLAVDGVLKYENPLVIPSLIDYFNKSGMMYIHDAVVQLIPKLTKKHMSVFYKIIKDGGSDLKEFAVEKLKDIKNKTSLYLLMSAVKDNSASVKLAVIDALSKWKKKYYVPILVNLLDDNNEIVREKAQQMLANAVDKNDIEILINFFNSAKTEEAKEITAELLHKIISEKDPSSIEKILKTDSFHLLVDVLRRKGLSLGEYASTIMGEKFYTEEAIDTILRTLYSSSPDAKAQALNALGKLANPIAVPHIIKFLNDGNWFVRRNALEALKTFSKQVKPELIEPLMNDEHPSVRLSALELLIKNNKKYKEKAVYWAILEDSKDILAKIRLILEPFKNQELADVFVSKIDSVDIITRMQALRKLLMMWEDVNFEFFTGKINSDNWRLRFFGFMVLSMIDNKKAYSLIDNLMKETEIQIKMILPEYLVSEFGEKSFPYILQLALNEQNEKIRKKAVKMLINFSMDEDLESLILEILEKEESITVLIELANIIDEFNYMVPRDNYYRNEWKLPVEFKQIVNRIYERAGKEEV